MSNQPETTARLSAKRYVQACFPTATIRTGSGYFCIQATTSIGTVWLGSAGTEDQAWDAAAYDLDQNGGCGSYAVPSWDCLSRHLKEVTL